MRHLLSITSAVILLCACTNPLDYQSGQNALVIIMNAQLRTDETHHTVWLNRGYINAIGLLDEAKVRCFINGEPVASAVLEKNPKYAYRNSSAYTFNAEIHPGDEVRLEAVIGGLRASATAVAPQPATLVAVDTAAVQDSPYASYMYMGSPDRILSCKLQLRDRPGETNWYRLSVLKDEEKYIHFVEDPTLDETRNVRTSEFYFDQDPILNDGYQDQASSLHIQNVSLLNAVYNLYCSFRDIRFADGEASVEIHYPLRQSGYLGRGYEHSSSLTRVISVRPRLTFRFLTLSQEEFSYIAALNRGSTYDYQWYALTEPISYPSNVEGGLGLVTVASASDITLDLPAYVIVEAPFS